MLPPDEKEEHDKDKFASSLLQQGMRTRSSFLNPVMNLCLGGRLVPELFVIGAQKAGTTSLAMELTSGSPNIILPESDENYEKKEPHSFDWKFNEGMQTWLNRWPSCQHEYRAVAVDMTPVLHSHVCVPCRIRERYGDLSSRLRFFALLRDPLKRMQSAFYHGQAGFHKDWYYDVSFEQYVKIILRDPDYCPKREEFDDELKSYNEDPFCDSLYAEQLEEWLKHFDGSQLTIIPYKFQVARSGGTPSVAESLYSKFDIPGARQEVENANSREHKALEEDLAPDILEKIQKLLNDRTGYYVVARVLSSHGVNLYNYDGPNHENGIADFLEANW